MACHLTVFDPESRAKSEYDCDEANTARVVEDDHIAKGSGSYTDVSGKSFEVDWTKRRLIGFARKRDDGTMVASGGADGCQSPAC